MATLAKKLTYEEWLQMPTVQDGREEVVDGELQFMPPNHYPHGKIVQRLALRFGRQLDESQVDIQASDFGLVIQKEPLTCRTPDLAIFWESTVDLRDGLYWSPPGLVVEVLSPSETKRRKESKLKDYASIGVPEAWLVSPEAESVEIYLLHKGRLVSSGMITTGDLNPTQFPGVTIRVPEIWPQ